MKNRFMIKAIVCLMLTILSVVLVSCNGIGRNDTTETPHTHEWGEWTVVYEATCTAEGRMERVCACGKDIKILPKLAHTSNDWIIDKEATLTENGKKHQVCSVCKAKFNETIVPRLTLFPLDGQTLFPTFAWILGSGNSGRNVLKDRSKLETTLFPLL